MVSFLERRLSATALKDSVPPRAPGLLERFDALLDQLDALLKLLEIVGTEPITCGPAEERRSRLLRAGRLLDPLEQVVRET